MVKICKKCGLSKPENQFFKNGKSLTALCKKCHNARTVEWKKNNPEKMAKWQRGSELKYRYGITQNQLENLVEEQRGLCPICQENLTKKCVDHDHATGQIRGVLCFHCNAGLGLFQDSSHVTQRAANYLKDKGVTKAFYVPRKKQSNKLLVTGASGLVGSALQAIAPDGTVFLNGRHDCDLLRWVEVDRIFNKIRPLRVLHLAAKVGGVKINSAQPATFFLENTTINNHIVEASRLYGVNKMVCMLSTCVFPDPCPLPLIPTNLHAGLPHPSNYGYAFAKRMLAVQCSAFNQEYGTNFVPVIPCNIYGPNDNFNLENSHVVPALIYKMWTARLKGEPMVVWGSGKPLREFIYSGDIARLCLNLLDLYESKEPIILSTGIEYMIKDLVYAIAKAMDFKGDIIFDTTKPEGQYRKPSNNTPLMELFPKFKFTPLDKGITKTVEWFADNYPNVRL